MIDRAVKKCLGQMAKGVQVVAARHDGVTRAYTSHWVGQISFDEPVLLASVSPKHDTHPLIEAAGWFSVSVLAGDQVEFKRRDWGNNSQLIPLQGLVEKLKNEIKSDLEKLNQ